MAQISVVVPVYKVEPYLRRCVDSILGQSYSDFELILVDDGSPDNCGKICDEYAASDSRVRVIHQANGGLSAARNAGIQWALDSSESCWIAFVDSDDWLHGDYLRLLLKAAEESGCLISVCEFVRTAGEPLADAQDAYSCMCAEDFYCSEEIPAGIAAITWNKLYAKELFRDVRFPLGKLNEDEFTTYRLVFAVDRIAYVPAGLYAYFQNNQGIMLSAWNPRRLHILEAVEQQLADAEKWGNARFYRKAVRHYVYACHEQLRVANREYRQQLRSKYRRALKLGRECGVFTLCWGHLWAYEEAYPVKPFWWVLFKGSNLLNRLTGKEEKA